MPWKTGDALFNIGYTVVKAHNNFQCVTFWQGVNVLSALYLGIKMFVVEFIFLKFPRFKQRHDSVYILWQGLPTNAQVKSKSINSQRSTVSW